MRVRKKLYHEICIFLLPHCATKCALCCFRWLTCPPIHVVHNFQWGYFCTQDLTKALIIWHFSYTEYLFALIIIYSPPGLFTELVHKGADLSCLHFTLYPILNVFKPDNHLISLDLKHYIHIKAKYIFVAICIGYIYI